MISIYADGACQPNPGKCGIGALLRYGKFEKEISEYIGEGTNNVAELTAIKVALEAIKRKDIPVVIYTDSRYAVDVLTGEKIAHTNTDLVVDLTYLMCSFDDINIHWIKGHNGNPYQERADQLANAAIAKATK